MIIPIRCFTCGKVLADKYDVFMQKSQELEAEVQKAEAKGESHPAHHNHASFDRISKDEILTSMGLTRYCCRRHMLGQVDMMHVI
jgi:DNA-directed RNA polymerase subunit N (RpoN/RPB10)